MRALTILIMVMLRVGQKGKGNDMMPDVESAVNVILGLDEDGDTSSDSYDDCVDEEIEETDDCEDTETVTFDLRRKFHSTDNTDMSEFTGTDVYDRYMEAPETELIDVDEDCALSVFDDLNYDFSDATRALDSDRYLIYTTGDELKRLDKETMEILELADMDKDMLYEFPQNYMVDKGFMFYHASDGWRYIQNLETGERGTIADDIWPTEDGIETDDHMISQISPLVKWKGKYYFWSQELYARNGQYRIGISRINPKTGKVFSVVKDLFRTKIFKEYATIEYSGVRDGVMYAIMRTTDGLMDKITYDLDNKEMGMATMKGYFINTQDFVWDKEFAGDCVYVNQKNLHLMLFDPFHNRLRCIKHNFGTGRGFERKKPYDFMVVGNTVGYSTGSILGNHETISF